MLKAAFSLELMQQATAIKEDGARLAFSSDIEQSTHDLDNDTEAQSTHDSDNEFKAHHYLFQLYASSQLLSTSSETIKNGYIPPH